MQIKGLVDLKFYRGLHFESGKYWFGVIGNKRGQPFPRGSIWTNREVNSHHFSFLMLNLSLKYAIFRDKS